jgi:cytochrome c nitrite reductase small subunit
VAIPKENRDWDKDRKRKRGIRNLLGIVGAIAVLTALATWGMHFTSQPNFCSNCHEIKPQVVSWNVGGHKGVPCLDCHSNPGTFGYVSRKLKGLGEVYLHFTNQIPAVLVSKINTETCIQCHTGQRSDYPQAKNINLVSGPQAPKVSHKEVLTNKTSCITCHRYTAHPYDEQQQAKTAQ